MGNKMGNCIDTKNSTTKGGKTNTILRSTTK